MSFLQPVSLFLDFELNSTQQQNGTVRMLQHGHLDNYPECRQQPNSRTKTPPPKQSRNTHCASNAQRIWTKTQHAKDQNPEMQYYKSAMEQDHVPL